MIVWDQPSPLDRVEQHRCRPEWVAQLWHAEEALLLKVTDTGAFFTDDDGRRLRMTRPFVEFDPQRHHLLGTWQERPVFSVRAVIDGEVHDLRQCAHLLPEGERDIAMTAVALEAWHQRSVYCSICGAVTEVVNGGTVRRCPQCQAEHFPRTDPAVIVAILDPAERLLLARQDVWPPRRFSILAGFVEIGESLEQAVHREMAEEADVTLESTTYFASQPWPFPRSLMIGFVAHAVDDQFTLDGTELTSGRWWTRDELRAAIESGEVDLPMNASIASRMIRSWLAGEISR